MKNHEQWQKAENETSEVIRECMHAASCAAHEVLQDTAYRSVAGILRAFSAAHAAEQEINKAWSNKSGRKITLLCMESGIQIIVATALYAAQKNIENIEVLSPWEEKGILWSGFVDACTALDAYDNFCMLSERDHGHLYEDETFIHPADILLQTTDAIDAERCNLSVFQNADKSRRNSHNAKDKAADADMLAIEKAYGVFKEMLSNLGNADSPCEDKIVTSGVLRAFMACSAVEKSINEQISKTFAATKSSKCCIYLSRSAPADAMFEAPPMDDLVWPEFVWLSRLEIVAAAFWLALENREVDGSHCITIGDEWGNFVAACIAMRHLQRFKKAVNEEYDCGGMADKLLETVKMNDLQIRLRTRN